MEQTTIKELFLSLYRMVKAHIGSGNKAHLPATLDSNGFMTSKHVKDLNMSKGIRNYLPDGADIFSLSPGQYLGKSLINAPKGNQNQAFVDVSFNPTNTSKLFRFIQLNNNEEWVKTTYSHDTYLSNEWCKTIRKVNLYEGSVSDVNVKMQCIDKLSVFSEFEFLVTFEGSNAQWVSVPSSNPISFTSINLPNGVKPGQNSWVAVAEMKLLKNNTDNTFLIEENNSVEIVNGGAVTVANKTPIIIKKIVGVL